MAREYTAKSIEVLSGLDPVKKRPGMYTETSRPNHLALEVIDNSIDEALGGFASKISVCLFKDGSLSVEDDGRGMPVDIHPDEGIPAVEYLLGYMLGQSFLMKIISSQEAFTELASLLLMLCHFIWKQK